MEEETKKPCTPVEEAGGDYNELGLYLHSKENNQTLEAAQTLWEFLPGCQLGTGGCGQHPDGRERRGPAAGAALQ